MTLTSLTIRLKSTLRVPHPSLLRNRLILAAQSGLEQLFNQLLRPKFRTFIPDLYKDISYVLDEDGYSTADYQDLARKRFIKAWEVLVDGYKVHSMYNLTHRPNILLIYVLGCLIRGQLSSVHRAFPRCPIAALGKIHHGCEIYRGQINCPYNQALLTKFSSELFVLIVI